MSGQEAASRLPRAPALPRDAQPGPPPGSPGGHDGCDSVMTFVRRGLREGAIAAMASSRGLALPLAKYFPATPLAAAAALLSEQDLNPNPRL